ncbi:N-acetylmuramoyl-L-alanine amidase [Brevibacterium luteolum]|uniref:N-acetylmuramoyl-L-alanine amidase n=1 Tax=Brevibacterium luteolum TaxID=199591 RepID=A0A2N6PLA4_9MICO|nr:N-acetylmuramoyl-L-alanine amidase [Brevibacterium luteolum]PMB99456.1 N-acetylmuramoyl-L-alanine amidase [Brevibacterium luteolum]
MTSPPLARATGAVSAVLLSAGILLTGCGSDPASAPETPATSAPVTTPVAGETVGSGSPSPSATPEVLDGLTIALDPGHNGKNSRNPSEINRKVPDGRGGTKACNTTGTATAGDYPEHAFTFDVAERAKQLLEDAGAEVVMSRSDDDGVGPCVDERGQFAGEADADALVSIHANGTEDTSAKGFHVIVADDAVHDGVGEPSRAIAEQMVTSFEDAEFAPNPAYGKDGIVARTDIAGLNHAEVPAVMIECGEMRNRDEAKLMESEDGRQRYAEAIVTGLEDYFAQQ